MGESTHVDFVLRQSYPGSTAFLIAECKRVNPKFSRWCFVKNPYAEEKVIFDRFNCQSDSITLAVSYFRGHQPRYHLGLELKTNSETDGGLPSRGAINEAVAQALRGTSGFINHLFRLGPATNQPPGILTFIPVVFTTADLWVSDVDLGAADLATGNLQGLRCEKADWLWFNHNRSPKLRHAQPWAPAERDLRRDLELEFTRSVAVVSSSGIDTFLSRTIEALL
jgi:hypothetical protein